MAAVRWYLDLDHAADAVLRRPGGLGDRGAGQPAAPGGPAQFSPAKPASPCRAPRSAGRAAWGITRDELLRQLMLGDPAISLAPSGTDGVFVNPQTLRPGEEQVVVERLLAILHAARAGQANLAPWCGNLDFYP
jgi:hypothetical protein